MSESMLERAAKALWYSAEGSEWVSASDGTRSMYRHAARAVLEELKKPTDAMKVAGGLKCEALMFEGGGTGVIFDDMGTVFSTMIDQILSETRKP